MINHWNCLICKSYNDILQVRCVICQANKPDWVTSDYQARVEINRGIFLQYGILGVNVMTEQEELFAKFYNSEKILVKDMDDIQLREHREELRKIAFEAKARAVAADDEDRERRSKSKNKEWLLTPTEANQSTSDAINAVKQRAARMSKMDKTRKQLLAAGIDEETVNEMVRNMEKRATEKDVKTITFNKPSVDVTAVQVKTVKPSDDSVKPFDPTSLFK